SAGAKTVEVTTAYGTGTKVAAFTYVAPPTVTTITPSAGPTAGGTLITIAGTNLLGSTVTVGGNPATIVSTAAASITATTPTGTAGAKTVIVSAAGGTATKTSGFTYVEAPTIASITPSSGPLTAGTSITITGTNLTGASVKIGGAAATSVVATATSITAKAPAGTAGAKAVEVTTLGGTATLAGGYTHVARPVITTVTPTAGPLGGGTTITITGTSLANATVKVGGVAATGVVAGNTSITAVTPANTVGAKVIEVTTVGGVGSKAAAFTYAALPTIATITPAAGPTSGGTSITITGANLLGATVTVGGAPATAVVAIATKITAKVPAASAGLQDIVVTTPGGTVTKAGGFSFSP
ncbi:MAG: transporter, partial [Actinobacteria bacterium]|nr:transporter [Actinomycetota bacterium]